MANLCDWHFRFSFLRAGDASPLVWSDCAGLCWNLAVPGLGEAPHADSHSTSRSSASLGSFPRPGAQWLHKADYKLQRIPEGARSDAGANEQREPLRPTAERGELGKEGLDHTEPRPACLPWERGVISRSFQRGSRKRRSARRGPGREPSKRFAGGALLASGKERPPPPAPDGPPLGKEPKAQRLTLASSWAAANSHLQQQRPPKHFSSPVTGVVRFPPPFCFELPRQQFKTGGGLGGGGENCLTRREPRALVYPIPSRTPLKPHELPRLRLTTAEEERPDNCLATQWGPLPNWACPPLFLGGATGCVCE